MSQPKWAMCGVCGEVLWAGPGINPILRECECRATAVRPTESRGYVVWDKDKYKAAAQEAGKSAYMRVMKEAAEEAYTKYTSMGFEGKKLKHAIDAAQQFVLHEAETAASAATELFPTQPEVEMTDEELDPMVGRVPVRETTVDDLYNHEMNKLNRGETI